MGNRYKCFGGRATGQCAGRDYRIFARQYGGIGASAAYQVAGFVKPLERMPSCKKSAHNRKRIEQFLFFAVVANDTANRLRFRNAVHADADRLHGETIRGERIVDPYKSLRGRCGAVRVGLCGRIRSAGIISHREFRCGLAAQNGGVQNGQVEACDAIVGAVFIANRRQQWAHAVSHRRWNDRYGKRSFI